MRELPRGWVETTLAEIGKWGSGGTPKKGHPGYYGGPIPWAVIGDLNDSLVSTTQNSITALGLKESSAKLVEPGSLLIAMYGSIGKLGIAGMEMATNQAIAFCRPNRLMETKYLFWYLFSQRHALASIIRPTTERAVRASA